MTRTLVALALVLLATPLGAQQTARYARSAGDTLRYVEDTRGRVTIRTSQGNAEVRSEHHASIALAFVNGDTARAWYERLRLLSADQSEMKSPNTDAMIGRPFVLTFSPRGTVHLVQAPRMTDEIASMTDLTHQFDDLFISLPERPLARGLEWSDTLRSMKAGRPTDTYLAEAVRTFRVERDTVVDGEAAVIISVRSRSRLGGSSPLEGQAMTVFSDLRGEEAGIAIFAPGSGRLLSRVREGTLGGEIRVSGGPIVMPQTYRYTSTLRLQR